jgi:hypothetical protein
MVGDAWGGCPSIKRTALVFNPQTAPYYAAFLRNFKAAPTTLAAELSAMPVREGGDRGGRVSFCARTRRRSDRHAGYIHERTSRNRNRAG